MLILVYFYPFYANQSKKHSEYRMRMPLTESGKLGMISSETGGSMRKILSLTMLAVILFALFPGLKGGADETAYTAIVENGPLHLRAKPDKRSPSLGRYPGGTRVSVLADGDVFCRIRTAEGKEGYMMKEFLRFENGLPPMEIVTPTPAPTPDLTRQKALERGIDPNKPMIALTFDDGPQPETIKVLEILEKYSARATFFILGKNIAGNEEILKRAAEGGHQLGAHSWSHPNLNEISESAVRSQMTRTMDRIFEITGQQVRIMRPPYGASNRISRRPLAELGLPLILWSVDSLDWKTRSASSTIATIREKAANGAIILCHDVWAPTGQAMETVVPELIGRGFQLVTVAEMMSFRKEPLKPGWEYSFLDISKIEPGLTPIPPGQSQEP